MILDSYLEKPIPGISDCEKEAHFHLLPDDYFSETPIGDIILHIKMVHDLLNRISGAESLGSLVPVIDWRPDPRLKSTEVNIVTWDRAGLFHKLTAAFYYAGFSIREARAISREDNIAIDTFYVYPRKRSSFNESYAKQMFEECLNKKLASADYGETCLDEIPESSFSVSEDPDSSASERAPPKVEVYEELARLKAIVEIHTGDTDGLLYRLAQVIHSHEFDITAASIHTERSIAYDRMYVKPRTPGADVDRKHLIDLRNSLLLALKKIGS